MKEIPLANGGVVLVDDEDYEGLSGYRWLSNSDGYAYRSKVNPTTKRSRMTLMHRELTGAPQGVLVDHKNRNRLDNRRENLCLCNHKQNASNRSKLGHYAMGVCQATSFTRSIRFDEADQRRLKVLADLWRCSEAAVVRRALVIAAEEEKRKAEGAG